LTGISSSTDLASLIAPTLGALGFELVQVRLMGGGRPTLQIVAEPIDHARVMTVDDCAAISHAVSAVLDVADPIPQTYRLEVSSPGIERPLVTEEHFRRFLGQRARIETDQPLGGRRRFTGTIGRCDGAAVTIEAEDGPATIPLAAIRRARLVAEVPGAAPRAGGRRRAG
jgi:ribosome maturation factor RimP